MIDLENVNLREAEQAAYAAGDALKAKLLARIMDLEEELERLRDDAADNSLDAWEDENGPADAYMEFFFDCFEMLNCRYPVPSVTSDADKQVIFDAIARGGRVNMTNVIIAVIIGILIVQLLFDLLD